MILLSYTLYLNCQINNGQNNGNNPNRQNGRNDVIPNVTGEQVQNNANGSNNAIPIANIGAGPAPINYEEQNGGIQQ